MITLHLIRHGETVWHVENRYAGASDIDLTERGREQARALMPWAAATDVDVLVSSPLRRARETAACVAEAAEVPLLIEPGLSEADFGRAEGMTVAEMRATFPAELDAFLQAPASSPLPGGEPGASIALRGLSALARILAAAPDGGTVVVVAHTTLIRLVLCPVLGLPLDDYRRRFPVLRNATITTLLLPRASAKGELEGAGALIGYNVPPMP